MSTTIENTPLGVWSCKVGDAPASPEPGLDYPMRQAVEAAYIKIMGQAPDFIFSGWRQSLTEGERAAHENRLPDFAKCSVEITREEYDRLRKDSEFLSRLRDAGVDNWEGYDQAFSDPDEDA